MNRSQYLGVYNVAADRIKDPSKTYRVAIKLRNNNTGSVRWFNVFDHFESEAAAARVYNSYAISFFGKGAVLNDLIGADAGSEGIEEAAAYFAAKENRTESRAKSIARFKELRDAGHVFRTHLDLAAEQAAKAAATGEDPISQAA